MLTLSPRCAVAALLSATACASVPAHPLDVSPDDYAFEDHPKLLERLRSSPHGYLRFINRAFSQSVCRMLAPMLADAPAVNLHGDAHVEQYAVTDLGRGLTDFDDAAIGPAPIDLLRFGVSVTLAAQAHGWSAHTDALLTRFLQGYRAALEDPAVEAPCPRVVQRLRAGFRSDRARFLKWAESVSLPMPPADQAPIRAALRPYVDAMRSQSPELADGYFDVVTVRRLRLGIGSALDDKFIVRVEGPTTGATDDVVLEIKEVRDISGVSCLSANSAQDPFRILVAQSRIAYRPYRFLGYIRVDERTFWIHAWVDNYRELDIGQTAQSPEELLEVVYDVGVQLGRGHPNQIAAPLDLQLRRALIRRLDTHQSKFRTGVHQLAAEVHAAWERFVARSAPGEAPG